MDFHSLARRDLQALCKKNKIPANLTNVDMADALKALQKVEGLHELGNAQHSPERSANAEPRTAGRTSTRRKLVVNVEAASSQILTRSRRTTRRAVVDNESKNVDLPETPAPNNSRKGAAASTRRKIDSQLSECSEVQEKSDMGMAKTPAAVSTRRKVKTQKEEKSVPIVSSKRQSVRLLEKTMASLSLKEVRKVEAVKIEGLCDETEQVEQAKDKDMPGSDAEITENPEKMMNSDLEKGIEKESEYESNDNSPIEMEAEDKESITDVLAEISDMEQTEDWSKSQPMQKVDELDAIDDQISVDLVETTRSSVEQKSPLTPTLVSGSENAAAKMATSDEQKNPFSPLVSDSEIAAAAAEMTTSDDDPSDNEFDGIVEKCLKEADPCVSSPFADNTIQGQFPRQTVEKKMILGDDDANMDINKENNIEESQGGKFNEMSLRQLAKVYKEKLKIKNKNASKVGENRTALQKLPENASEAEAEKI